MGTISRMSLLEVFGKGGKEEGLSQKKKRFRRGLRLLEQCLEAIVKVFSGGDQRGWLKCDKQ